MTKSRASLPRPTALRDNRGMTLLETVIVLGVVALIIGAIWVVAGAVTENAKQYTFTQQQQQTVNNIRQLYQRIARFTSAAGTDLTTILDRQGAFPREARATAVANDASANGQINHAWKSTVTTPVRVFVRGATTFGIEYRQMPRKACINLAVKLSGAESGVTAVLINSTSYSGTSLPLTTITASGVCSADSGNYGTNTLEWQFSIRGN